MTFQDVEKAREAYNSRVKKQTLTTAMVIGILLIILLLSGGILGATFGLFFLGFFITCFAVIIATFANRKVYLEYRRAYKAYFIEQNLRRIFTDLSYSHDAGLHPGVLASTGMINLGNRYSSNDFTKGKYKDVAFSQADVHIEVEHTDSDGNTHYATIFKGRFMIFEFPKQFSFKLELIGKRFRAYRKPGTNQATKRKMGKISTESNEFNSAFRIHGEDGFEAFYILNPAFMVKLMKINERYKGKTIFCFVNNQLIIGLNDGKDSFEPPRASRPIDEATENAKVAGDIKIITDFVDQLSLAKKLFK